MPPSPVNPVQIKLSNTQEEVSSSGTEEMIQADEAMFRLIDGILPFEACLYHQVVPLSLEGTRLNLGMVNIEETAALDYVRRILAYMNCSLHPVSLSAKNHQALLSAYLNYTGQLRSATTKEQPEKPTDNIDQHNKATLILNNPESLDKLEAQTQTTSSPEKPSPTTSNNSHPRQSQSPKRTPNKSETPPFQSAPPSALSLPVLDVQAHYLSSPVEVLATLPPKNLLNELLARVLAGGIGRLYFERHHDRGRILWSQNGVLQSVLEGLAPSVFQGVINELKRLTHLSMLPVEKPKQVEIERLYKNNRLLLRLRVMPATHGEEATLQVLRGTALKFYQQQQLENLSRDALGIAQQLQHKVNEIRERTRIDPSLTTGQLEALPALDELVKSLEEQIKSLRVVQAQAEPQDNQIQ